jgi:hypothetical protein
MQLCALFERVMLKQMPLSAAALLPIIVLTGDVTGGAPPLSSVTLTPQQLGMIALTAVMSFFVNSTTYIIAELSPIRLPPPPLHPIPPPPLHPIPSWLILKEFGIDPEAKNFLVPRGFFFFVAVPLCFSTFFSRMKFRTLLVKIPCSCALFSSASAAQWSSKAKTKIRSASKGRLKISTPRRRSSEALSQNARVPSKSSRKRLRNKSNA